MPKPKTAANKTRGKKCSKKTQADAKTKLRRALALSNSENEGITMSKQLANKIQNRKRPAQKTSKKRAKINICGNGVIMPSLEDLEKLFEDSDEENDSTDKGPENLCEEGPCRKKIKKSAPATVSNSIFNAQSSEIAERLKNDTGSDSDTTIIYGLPPNVPDETLRFSPLPSTSRDRQTINENDKRLEKCITKTDLQSKNDDKTDKIDMEVRNQNVNSSISHPDSPDDEIEVIETPYDTIIINDDGFRIIPKKKSSGKKNDLNLDSPIVIDDEGFIAPTQITVHIANPTSPVVVDDVYSSVDVNGTFSNEDCEIIDVDNVLAENSVILEKYSQTQKLNTVTHVVPNDPPTEPLPSTSVTAIATVSLSNSIPALLTSEEEPDTPQLVSLLSECAISGSDYLREIVNTVKRIPLPILEPHEVPNCSLAHLINDFNKTGSITKAHEIMSRIKPNFSLTKIYPIRTIQRDCFHFLYVVSDREFDGRFLKSLETSLVRPQPRISENCSILSARNSLRQLFDLPPLDDEQTNIQLNASRRSEQQHTNNCRHRHANVEETATDVTNTVPPTSNSSRTQKKGLGDCPICMDSLGAKPMVVTLCGHVFCKTCLDAAIKTSGKRCPTCRKACKKMMYHPLYV